MTHRRLSSIQIIALGFSIIIITGTLLLMLPISCAEGHPTSFLTSLFTATSASCVTGLILVDTATYWSTFGQIVILCLIQIGGLGFMTIATFFLSFAKKSIDLRKRQIMAESINTVHIAGLKKITRKIFLGTALFEGTGAVLLAIRFVPEFGLGTGIYYGIFHSISAFCNAGFDLIGVRNKFCSLVDYSDDILVNLTIMALIVIGGIGFLVWDDVHKNKFHIRKYQLHTKIVLTVSAILIFGGAFLFFMFEKDNLLADSSTKERVLVSLFTSVSCRTAGFNTVDMALATRASILLMCFLMFVGGSSGSTAGGIKTTTIAVVASYLIADLRGVARPKIFGRTYEHGTHKKAMTVFTFNLLLTFTATLAICGLQEEFALTDVMYEVFSAMGTVGMSTGITRSLSYSSQLIIIFLMFCGRVGSISFALALLEKREQPAITYPSEAITVG